MYPCLSPGGSAVYDSPTAAGRLLVGTQNGVVGLEETAAGWREAGRGLADHHVCALIGEPVSGNYYAGTHDAGVFVSPDGRHWQAANNGLDHTNVFSMASVRRADGSVRLYAGTEPAALFQSLDFGQSWQRLTGLDHTTGRDGWMFPAPPFIAHVKQIAIHPQDADLIYVCVEQGGLYSSADAGQTWTEHTAGMPNDAHRVLLHPTSAPATAKATSAVRQKPCATDADDGVASVPGGCIIRRPGGCPECPPARTCLRCPCRTRRAACRRRRWCACPWGPAGCGP